MIEVILIPHWIFVSNEYTNFNATPELENLIGAKKIFDYPKPVKLIKALLALYPSVSFTILDFFAGQVQPDKLSLNSINRTADKESLSSVPTTKMAFAKMSPISV